MVPSMYRTLIGLMVLGSFAPFGDSSSPIMPSGQILIRARIEDFFEDKLPKTHQALSSPLAQHLVRLCQDYQFNPLFILSVIQTESRFHPSVVSHAGAIGLMQVLPHTSGYITKLYGISGYQHKEDLKNPFINLSVGIAYLSYLREKFNDERHYLIAYNMGPTAFQKLLRKGRKDVINKYRYVSDINNYFEGLRRSLI